jgi:hypothetical protein
MPIELNRVQNKNVMQGAANAVTPPVAGAPAPEARPPELTAPPVNWSELISKLGQMGIDTTSGLFGAASSLAQDPNNIGLIANGQGIPGVSNKDIAALGAIAKGFESSRAKGLDPLTEANINKLNAETEKLKAEGTSGKSDLEMKSLMQKVYGPVKEAFNKDEDIKDEITRADSIEQIEKILNNPDSLKNRKATETLNNLFIQVIRPEYKRISGAEPANFGSVQGFVSEFFKGGGKNYDEFLNKIAAGQVLDPGDRVEYQNMVDNFKDLSKERFKQKAQSYLAELGDLGPVGEQARRYLKVPKGYDLADPKKGDRKTNANNDVLEFNGQAWVLVEAGK